MIYQSFDAWAQSPIKTTIETRPINEITFPKVTICPPKNTYTDLNYNLKMLENLTLDDDTRNNLMDYSAEILNDYLYEEAILNIKKLQDTDRYFNWYHGYTEINMDMEIIDDKTGLKVEGSKLRMNTFATSGTIQTENYGVKFDADKVELILDIRVFMNIPCTMVNNQNSTLHIEIEKLLIEGKDKFNTFYGGYNHKNILHVIAPKYSFEVAFEGALKRDQIENLKLKTIPGFKITWNYTGDVQKQSPYYSNEGDNYGYIYCKEQESREKREIKENAVGSSYSNDCMDYNPQNTTFAFIR